MMILELGNEKRINLINCICCLKKKKKNSNKLVDATLNSYRLVETWSRNALINGCRWRNWMWNEATVNHCVKYHKIDRWFHFLSCFLSSRDSPPFFLLLPLLLLLLSQENKIFLNAIRLSTDELRIKKIHQFKLTMQMKYTFIEKN